MNRKKLFSKPIQREDIFFISDIENFTKDISKEILSNIKNANIKLIVIIGDTLSFLNDQLFSYIAYDKSYQSFEFIYGREYLKKEGILENKDYHRIAQMQMGELFSKNLLENHEDEIKTFLSFLNTCKKNKVVCVHYSGNHDCLMNYVFMLFNNQNIPILKKMYEHPAFYIPPDFELIELNKNLFLTGTHTVTDELDANEKLPEVEKVLSELEGIPNPEQTIFVSHIPGKAKFSKLGSSKITALKKRYRFMYHYHGHCKNYNGEYIEEGVPTISAHYENLNDKII